MEEYPNKSKETPDERTLEARWCVDSETGKRYLIDLRTGKVIGEWIKHPST